MNLTAPLTAPLRVIIVEDQVAPLQDLEDFFQQQPDFKIIGACATVREAIALINKTKPVSLPTPWNQLEAGILFGLKLPLLIFKEADIEGGVFDVGISDAFVHNMPPGKPDKDKEEELKQVILKWFGEVSRKYNEY